MIWRRESCDKDATIDIRVRRLVRWPGMERWVTSFYHTRMSTHCRPTRDCDLLKYRYKASFRPSHLHLSLHVLYIVRLFCAASELRRISCFPISLPTVLQSRLQRSCLPHLIFTAAALAHNGWWSLCGDRCSVWWAVVDGRGWDPIVVVRPAMCMQGAVERSVCRVAGPINDNG